MNGTPWGYIQEKKRAETALSEAYSLERENKQLKEIIKKLVNKKELTENEKQIIEDSLK